MNNGDYYYFGWNLPQHISGIALDKTSLTLPVIGDTGQLTVTIYPNGYVDEANIVWNSDNTSIATVSQTGLVTCVTPGECTITVTVNGIYTATCSVSNIPHVYYSDANFAEYQSLVNDIGSINFVDTGKRYRFSSACYIGNRTAINMNGTTWAKVNLDTLTVTSSITLGSGYGGRIWYFGDNRILTRRGIVDFDGNMITSFGSSYNSVTPGDEGVIWANASYDIYKGIVVGDNVTFTKIGTGGSDQNVGQMCYGKLGAYLLNYNDTSGSGNSSYIDPATDTITNFTGGSDSRRSRGFSGPDGKMYRWACRDNGWGRLQKIGTGNEGFVGSSLSTSWAMYGQRCGKILGNIVSGGMNSSNGTGNGYGSNSYFIATDGTLTLAQSNAFAYDTNIYGDIAFIDENGWRYSNTAGGGSGVILKTNKDITDLNWKNPFLYR